MALYTQWIGIRQTYSETWSSAVITPCERQTESMFHTEAVSETK